MKCSAVTMIDFVTFGVVATPALAQNHESTLAALILKSYKLLAFDSQVMDISRNTPRYSEIFSSRPDKKI